MPLRLGQLQPLVRSLDYSGILLSSRQISPQHVVRACRAQESKERQPLTMAKYNII